MKYLSSLIVVLSAVVAVAAAPMTRDVALAISGYAPMGSAFRAGGVYRTAAHVVRGTNITGIGWPGDISPAHVTCRDDVTDSASLVSAADMVDWLVGSAPRIGDLVMVVGFNLSWQIVRHSAQVSELQQMVVFKDEEDTMRSVGPVALVPYKGLARGMSGGPVLRDGQAVAMTFGYNGDYLFVVPLVAQKCPSDRHH